MNGRAMSAPRICCLDLDTFFVSVESVLDPFLEGKQVVVGGRPGTRGMVTACSYEVREVGVRSGMSLTEAGRLAPDAVYLPVRDGAYSEHAEKVRRAKRRDILQREARAGCDEQAKPDLDELADEAFRQLLVTGQLGCRACRFPVTSQ